MIQQLHKDINGTGIYLGTAPREKVNGTKFVSTASEVPLHFTIPTHLELCFTPKPPSRLYFYVGKPNPPPGGQTPLSDFRGVWRDLRPTLRESLVRRGMLYERRYYNEHWGMPLDPLQTKSWQQMFLTDDKRVVESMASAQHFTVIWDEYDNLLLEHVARVFKVHPATGEEYWSTHFNVLHAATNYIPYLWDSRVFHSPKSWAIGHLIRCINYLRVSLLGLPYGHDMVYLDDRSPISWEDAVHIRQVIHNHTWMFDWRARDMLLLDNYRTAHGRTPWFSGDRKVYVAWN